jgi:hypothetical protein
MYKDTKTSGNYIQGYKSYGDKTYGDITYGDVTYEDVTYGDVTSLYHSDVCLF